MFLLSFLAFVVIIKCNQYLENFYDISQFKIVAILINKL